MLLRPVGRKPTIKATAITINVFAYHYIIKGSVSKEKFEEIIVKAVGQSEKKAFKIWSVEAL